MCSIPEIARDIKDSTESVNSTEVFLKVSILKCIILKICGVYLSLAFQKTIKSVPPGRPRQKLAQETNLEKENGSNLYYNEEVNFDSILHDLRTELDVKRREEKKLQKEITNILSESHIDGSEQSRSFSLAVSRLNNAMLLVEADAKQLASSLCTISRLADNISGKVHNIFCTVSWMYCLTQDHLLGVCSEGVDEAIRNEDFEQAAQHIHRFLTLDRAVFQFRDSTEKEEGQSVRHSYEVLTNAATRLKEILEKKLDDAVTNNDLPAMQRSCFYFFGELFRLVFYSEYCVFRFVKLFPLLGEHNNGLRRFKKYLSGIILNLGDSNIKIMQAGGTDDKRINVLYADTLFLFLEGVANLLETHQPLIESAYGADKLLDFINMLQVLQRNKKTDIDDVVVKVIDSFFKKRQLDKRIKAVQKLHREEKNPEKITNRPDAIELDVLLSEICLMNTHTEMYWRYVRGRIGDSRGKDKIELLNHSLVGTKMQELLGQYILLEQYYMEESVRKAIDMDTREEGLVSSVVDDVLFLVRKCVRRAMSSGSIDCVCATLNNGVAFLETTFHHYMYTSIQAGYPSVGFAAEALQTAQTAYNVIQHGKTVTEAGPDAQRESFLTALNNVRSTAEMLGELRKGLSLEWSKTQRSDVESGKLDHALGQLNDVARKMQQLATAGVEILCKSAFRTKLKSSCDSYLDLPHSLTDSQFAEFEAVDPFIEHFNTVLDKLIAYFEPLLLKENYQALLLSVCSETDRQMERVIMKCTFNRLGGLQLDKEFRQLSGYLSGVAGWSARERTARLAQIVSLLNVESIEEASELWEQRHSSSIVRPLTAAEARKILQLRADFSPALVQQLEL
uniref:Conserved oligomeric Golgi complex subunit 4 n=1 Tax=Heterorhabditis bacteriophora TaxID=37862 RepID=A0A1I7XTL7_HETBA